MMLPGSIISGTDLLTTKLANQSKHVDIDTPLARTFNGKISGGYNLCSNRNSDNYSTDK